MKMTEYKLRQLIREALSERKSMGFKASDDSKERARKARASGAKPSAKYKKLASKTANLKAGNTKLDMVDAELEKLLKHAQYIADPELKKIFFGALVQIIKVLREK